MCLLLLAIAPIALGANRVVSTSGNDAPTVPSEAGEYEVKAAYLYNFGKFVAWPEGSLPSSDPLVICVLGDDPFGAVLDDTIKDKTVRERALTVRRIKSTDRVRDCHILFLSSAEEHRLPGVLRGMGSANVLTVGETDAFLDKGGAITLVARDRKVRFEVNLRAAHKAGLEMSSQLLKVAANVIEDAERK